VFGLPAPFRCRTLPVSWNCFNLAADPDLPGSIPGATRFSEK
jgi:hypothetical protein